MFKVLAMAYETLAMAYETNSDICAQGKAKNKLECKHLGSSPMPLHDFMSNLFDLVLYGSYLLWNLDWKKEAIG